MIEIDGKIVQYTFEIFFEYGENSFARLSKNLSEIREGLFRIADGMEETLGLKELETKILSLTSTAVMAIVSPPVTAATFSAQAATSIFLDVACEIGSEETEEYLRNQYIERVVNMANLTDQMAGSSESISSAFKSLRRAGWTEGHHPEQLTRGRSEVVKDLLLVEGSAFMNLMNRNIELHKNLENLGELMGPQIEI